MIDEPLEISLMRQSLDYLERAYEFMLEHEVLCTDVHKQIQAQIEDAIDRMLYLQIPNNKRKGPKYMHMPWAG